MATIRQNQISRLIQKELGMYFQQQAMLYNPGGIITVTVVRITPDLSMARVYLSIYPSGKEKTLEMINQENKKIRHYLSQRIRNQMRVMPELSFFLDDSLDYIDNIDKLLH